MRTGDEDAHALVRRIALSLPGVREKSSYGTPGFRVGDRLFLRLHQDGVSLVVRAEQDVRDALLEADPHVFYVTDHYAGRPWVLVRLDAVGEDQLADVIEQGWRARAGPRLIRSFDASR